MALYPAAVIVENATFVAPETDAPAAFLIVMNTELVAALEGIDVNVRVQLLWSPDLPMFTPQAVGVPPGPEMSPETMTYSTAASTTVIATIKIVAMTGDTACSSLRKRVFIVSFLPGGCLLQGVRVDHGRSAHDLDLVSSRGRHRTQPEHVTGGHHASRVRGDVHAVVPRCRARRERDVRRSRDRRTGRVPNRDEHGIGRGARKRVVVNIRS